MKTMACKLSSFSLVVVCGVTARRCLAFHFLFLLFRFFWERRSASVLWRFGFLPHPTSTVFLSLSLNQYTEPLK